MKNFNRILLLLIICYSGFSAIMLVQILHDYPLFYTAKGKWTLVWNDEFNDSTLDQTKWMTGDRSCSYNSYQKEIQAISRENITVKDGCLILASKDASWKNSDEPYYITGHISGQVKTGDKCAWTYGRFEIRVKLPDGEGILSSASLCSVDGKPSQEILLMMMSGYDSYTIFMNNRWGTDQLRNYVEEEGLIKSNLDFSAGFHTFAIEWEPRSIWWYVDGVVLSHTNRNVPEIPLSLNLGTTAGNLYLYYGASKFAGRTITLPDMPQYYIVDWVRVYQRR